MHTTFASPAVTASPTVTFGPPVAFHFNDGSIPDSVRVVAVYFWLSVNEVFSAVNALRRSDFAPASCARERAPRNCGMAIAIKMAMINTTTINSMRVNPSSASRRRAIHARIDCTWLAPFLRSHDGCTESEHRSRFLSARGQSLLREPPISLIGLPIGPARSALLDQVDHVE